jgi:hypothetical protein
MDRAMAWSSMMNDQSSGEASSDRGHPLAADDAAVGFSGDKSDLSLANRLTRVETLLEQEDKRSWINRSSKSMSLLALIISLVAGGYGLFDSFYLAGQRDMEKEAQEVRDIVHRISELNAQVSSLMAKRDFESAMAINLIANGEKLPILVRAEELLRKHDETFIDPATLLTLAAEQLNFANNATALEYAKRAIDLAATNQIMRAEAHRYAGRVMFSPGPQQDRSSARQHYERGLDTVTNFSSFASEAVEFNIISEWILSEVNFGDCERAKTLAVRMNQRMSEWKMPQVQKQVFDGKLPK